MLIFHSNNNYIFEIIVHAHEFFAENEIIL